MAVNGSVWAPAILTPEELFRRSYNAFQKYPRRLIYKNCSEYSLTAYADLLESREGDLFGPVDKAVIPMIELNADRKGKLLDQDLLHLLTL
jgi:hypothetical protein